VAWTSRPWFFSVVFKRQTWLQTQQPRHLAILSFWIRNSIFVIDAKFGLRNSEFNLGLVLGISMDIGYLVIGHSMGIGYLVIQ